jgi:hypothetical protein
MTGLAASTVGTAISIAVLADRTCVTCGATYRSELATACAHCGTARAVPWGQWRLASADPAG